MHVLPAEQGTKALQFDVCCKAIGQNFDCGCDRYAILRLDTLILMVSGVAGLKEHFLM